MGRRRPGRGAGAGLGGPHAPLLRSVATALIVEDALEPAAAIVALGGQVPFRPMEAAELYRAGWAPRVVVVRGARLEEHQALRRLGIVLPESWEIEREVLLRRGVPASAILVPEGEAEGTLEELAIVARAIEPEGKPVILVTSKIHTRRVRTDVGARDSEGARVPSSGSRAATPSSRGAGGASAGPRSPWSASTSGSSTTGQASRWPPARRREGDAVSVVLGINAYHGDVAAALVRDGELVAAVEEERFRRVKHWAGFPREAVRACLAMAGVAPEAVDHFAISRDPAGAPLAEGALRAAPPAEPAAPRRPGAERGAASATRGVRSRGLGSGRRDLRAAHALGRAPPGAPGERVLRVALRRGGGVRHRRLRRLREHVAAPSAQGARLRVLDRVYFPHSLGLFYLAITQYLGFPKYGDEYKVMGLAAYGEPDSRRRAAPARAARSRTGGFELDLVVLPPHVRRRRDDLGRRGADARPGLHAEARGAARARPGARTSRSSRAHEAIAASLQAVFEEAAFHVLRALHARTRLAAALPGRRLRDEQRRQRQDPRARRRSEEVYIQPAAGDNGTALGAAFYVWHQVLGRPRRFVMEHALLGAGVRRRRDRARRSTPARAELARLGLRDRASSPTRTSSADWTAERLAEGKVVGWFQGRMEWGARALGNRSILADPRRADMREIINTQDQVPREVPAVRAVDPRGGARRVLRRAPCPTRS